MSILLLLRHPEAGDPEVDGTVWTSAGPGVYPDLSIQVSFSPPGTAAAAEEWLDVAAYVRAWSCARARRSALQRYEAGRAQLVLDNRTGWIDPVTHVVSGTVSGGTALLSGTLLPMTQLRVRARWNGGTYAVWRGYLESPMTELPGGYDQLMHAGATDTFLPLNLSPIDALARSAETTGARFAAVAAHVGLPTDRYQSTADGQSTIAAGTISTDSALGYLQQLAETENGQMYVDAGGTLRFEDRHHRILNRTVSGTIGAGTQVAWVPIADGGLDATYSDDELWTGAEVTPEGGSAQVAWNTAGTARFLRRKLSRSILAVGTVEAASAAEYLADRYGTPRLVVRTVKPQPLANAGTAWGLVLGAEISSAWAVEATTPSADSIAQTSYLEGVEHSWRPGSWDVSWSMSAADEQDYWVLGDPIRGVLGSTTRLAY